MNVWRFLKDSIPAVVAFLVIFLMVNCFLLVSTPLEQSLSDILYLDLLLLITASVFFIAGFLSWRNRYRDIFEALQNDEDFQFILPAADRLDVELMHKLVDRMVEKTNESVWESDRQFEALNDYITRWVHEIKIPLSVCELLLERLDGESADHQASEELNLEITKIKFLVKQVLYASRAYASSQDLQIDEVALEKAVREAVKRNSVFFYSKNIEVVVENVDFNILTDQKGLSYILDQLLHNASKYSEAGRKVEIYATENDQSVILTVHDHGMGIPKKDIDRVFDMGFTGENGRKTAKSTGMGLYFSKKVADRLGHRLSVGSQVGEYTEFHIEFFKFSDYFNVTKM